MVPRVRAALELVCMYSAVFSARTSQDQGWVVGPDHGTIPNIQV